MEEIDQLSLRVQKSYENLRNWRKVAAVFGITSGLAYRIAIESYEPKEPHLRVKLGLPALAPAPVCRVCGEVHTVGFCTAGLTGVGMAPICPVCGEVHTVDFCAKDLDVGLAPICPKCGQVHTTARCRTKSGKARPRASINTQDPESAARTIIRRMGPEQIAALVDFLVTQRNKDDSDLR